MQPMHALTKIGLALLTLTLIPLVAATGPQGLGAVLGAVLMVGVVRMIGPGSA